MEQILFLGRIFNAPVILVLRFSNPDGTISLPSLILNRNHVTWICSLTSLYLYNMI